MAKINVNFEITPEQAFDILCQSLHVRLDDEITADKFVIENDEIVVKDCDDRGELYLALYHLATKMFMNTEFRHLFEDPNTLMGELYLEKVDKEYERLQDV